MSIFRSLMMANASEVPSTYRRVEFLRSDGSAYINTGIVVPEEGLQFDLEYQNIEIASDKTCFGSRWQSAPYIGFLGTYFVRGEMRNGVIGATSVDFTTQIVGEKVKGYLSLYKNGDSYFAQGVFNGVISTTDPLSVSYIQPGNHPVFLFASNDRGSAVKITSVTNIYRFAVRNHGGYKIADCIPCVRESDGVPGMWDKVRRTFYTNAAAKGSFVYSDAEA